MPLSSSKGAEAERQALAFLQSKGHRLVMQNYRTRWGEIDLITLDGGELVFVEVRIRESMFFGGAVSSVTPAKQRKLAATAAVFLDEHSEFADHPCRFDVVAMEKAQTIHYPAAFYPEE